MMRLKCKFLSKYFLVTLVGICSLDVAAAPKPDNACKSKGYATRVAKLTNYAPAARPGDMNGRCGTSASGYDACKFLLEDCLNTAGGCDTVMAAVPQSGGTSFMYGGIYRCRELEQQLGVNGCLQIFAGDRYNTKSNGLSKADIVTRKESSAITERVNNLNGCTFEWLGRAPKMGGGVSSKTRHRAVQRIPEAQVPLRPVEEWNLADLFKEIFT